MCKYCKVDPEPMINTTTDGAVSILEWVFISGSRNGDRYLNSSVDVCDKEVLLKTLKINYCPMCGRKLSGGDCE